MQTIAATTTLPLSTAVDFCELKLVDDGRRFEINVFAVRAGKQEYASRAARDWLYNLSQVCDSFIDQHSGKPHAAVSDITCLEVVKHFGDISSGRILFADEVTKLTFKSEVASFYLANWVEEANTKWYESKELPAHSFELNADNPLSEYQQMPVVAAMAAQSFALFMEQGTGKTATAIAIACNRHKIQGCKRVLIVCPKNVRNNWVAEIRKFSTVNCKATVISGEHYDRQIELVKSVLGSPLTFTIISYDTLVKHVDWLKELKFNLCICDESHYFKSIKTDRAKALLDLRDSIPFRLILTGTPVGNTPLDLYTQLEFLGQGKSGFATFTSFKRFFANWRDNGSRFETYDGVKNLPILQRRLLRSSFTIRQRDALPFLPERLYSTRDVYMTREQGKVYQEVATKLMYEIENDLDSSSNEAMTIENVLTKLLRLAQITSGFYVIDAPEDEEGVPQKISAAERTRIIEPNPKIKALRQVFTDELAPDSKILIWACWRQDLMRIRQEFSAEFERGEAVLFYGDTSDADRQEAVKRFNNDPKCRIFLANQAAASTGLNLVGHNGADDCATQCDTVVYYSQNWSFLLREQSEARAHRRGTKSNVQIIDLCVPNTIDEEIRARVLKKKELSNSLTNVREMLLSIREHQNEIETE